MAFCFRLLVAGLLNCYATFVFGQGNAARWDAAYSEAYDLLYAGEQDRSFFLLQETLDDTALNDLSNKADTLAAAKVHKLTAYHYNARHDYFHAKNHYETAHRYYLGYGMHTSATSVLWINTDLGNIYTRLGDYEAAEAMLQEKLEYLHQQDTPSPHQLMITYNDLAVLSESRGNMPQARHYFRLGLAVKNGPASDYGMLYGSYAEWMLANDSLDQATVYADKSIRHLVKDPEPATLTYYGNALQTLGKVYLLQQKHQASIAHFKKAIATYQQAPQVNTRQVAKSYTGMAEAYAHLQHFSEALQAINNGFTALGIAFNTAENQPARTAETPYYENAFFELLEGKAELYLRWYEAEKDADHLQSAMQAFDAYEAADHHMRSHFSADASRHLHSAERHQRAAKALEAALTYFHISNDSTYLWKALQYGEQSKGLGLSDAVDLMQTDAYPDTAKALLYDLKLLEYQLQLMPADSSASRQKLVSDMHAVKRKLRQQFPFAINDRYQPKTPYFETLQTLLKRRKQSLISTFYSGQKVHLFYVDSLHFDHHVFTDIEWLSQTLSNLQHHMESPDASAPTKVQMAEHLHRLYERLFVPLFKDAPPLNVALITDGILGQFPMHLLLTQPTDPTSSFKDWPYWLRQTRFCYPVALRTLTSRPVKMGISRKLMVAPQVSGHRDLPALYPDENLLLENVKVWNGMLLYDADATSEQFFKHADEYAFIEIRTHAYSDFENPYDSWLLFDDGDATEGTEHQPLPGIYLRRLSLRAQVVLLLGCMTSQGYYQEGEGIQSLALIFASTGAQNNVASLWRVPVVSSEHFATLFDAELLAHQDPNRSVQQAQLALLDQAEDEYWRHPATWGAWINVGFGDRIAAPLPNYRSAGWTMAISTFAVFIVISLLVLRRKRKPH